MAVKSTKIEIFSYGAMDGTTFNLIEKDNIKF